ncbi:hypothetical protein ACFQOZ_01100 [Comamonas endophytica]
MLATVCFPSMAKEWFVVYGDPLQSQSDLIEIRPSFISTVDLPTVEVRVSRSVERNAYGGGKYRSHHSIAVIDCSNQAGWYTQMDFYGLPVWTGPVTQSRSFKVGHAPVAFAEIPGEADRLVRAACKLVK